MNLTRDPVSVLGEPLIKETEVSEHLLEHMPGGHFATNDRLFLNNALNRNSLVGLLYKQ